MRRDELERARFLYRFSPLVAVGGVEGARVHLAPGCRATRVTVSAPARGVQDGGDELGDVRVDLLVVDEEPVLQEGAVRGAAGDFLVQAINSRNSYCQSRNKFRSPNTRSHRSFLLMESYLGGCC